MVDIFVLTLLDLLYLLELLTTYLSVCKKIPFYF